MTTASTFAEHCREIAQRFVQTAIIVDDEAFMAPHDTAVDKVVTPGRQQSSATDGDDAASRSGRHGLDTSAIIEGFAVLGVICSAIRPSDPAMSAIRQADIVVLDWRLKADDPEFTLNLLASILTEEPDRNALRLLTVYTGEAELDRIQDAIVAKLKEAGLEPAVSEAGNVTYGHGRVVLYAKPSVNPPPAFRGREVDEDKLPQRLVDDFSGVTAGLLPGIALVSLTAVREYAHTVLDRFRADLDPAYLAHRACLPDPDDAERQMVNQIAEELRGLMDYAVADQQPAGRQPITQWITERAAEPPHDFQFGDKSLPPEQTVALATEGLERRKNLLPKGAFRSLSSGFSRGDAEQLDERLAWMFTSRTVFNAPPPRLWLGTVVRRKAGDADSHDSLLVCLRPRCDSVRLKGKTSFAFLPLGEPKPGQMQLIVQLGNSYERRGIAVDASGWQIHEFNPDDGGDTVVARSRSSAGGFVFTDVCDHEYEWLGELKGEFAHRMARTFADTLSRVAVDDSEWLRKSAQRP